MSGRDIVHLMDKEYFNITGKRLPFYFYRERLAGKFCFYGMMIEIRKYILYFTKRM